MAIFIGRRIAKAMLGTNIIHLREIRTVSRIKNPRNKPHTRISISGYESESIIPSISAMAETILCIESPTNSESSANGTRRGTLHESKRVMRESTINASQMIPIKRLLINVARDTSPKQIIRSGRVEINTQRDAMLVSASFLRALKTTDFIPLS